jgi:hypothetical protein
MLLPTVEMSGSPIDRFKKQTAFIQKAVLVFGKKQPAFLGFI